MSRMVKRVALDFDWPLEEVWPGYLFVGVCGMFSDKGCEACKRFTRAARLEGCPPGPTIEPPAGEGWQLWEDVSEGSPVTPVFATPEGLATYLAEHQSGIHRATYDGWLKFITGPGWAPSMVASGGILQSGVEAIIEDSE